MKKITIGVLFALFILAGARRGGPSLGQGPESLHQRGHGRNQRRHQLGRCHRRRQRLRPVPAPETAETNAAIEAPWPPGRRKSSSATPIDTGRNILPDLLRPEACSSATGAMAV